MKDSDVREFLDELESTDETRQLAARRRRKDDEIDELIELCRAQVDGETTHRSVAAEIGIDRRTAFRATVLFTTIFHWPTMTIARSGP